MSPTVIASLILTTLFLLFLIPNFKVLKEHEAMVIERLGSFHRVVDQPGIHFLIPLIDREIQKESLLPQTRTIEVNDLNDVLTYQYIFKINDIKMFCYKATEPYRIMEGEMKHIIANHTNYEPKLQELLLDYGCELISIDGNK